MMAIGAVSGMRASMARFDASAARTARAATQDAAPAAARGAVPPPAAAAPASAPAQAGDTNQRLAERPVDLVREAGKQAAAKRAYQANAASFKADQEMTRTALSIAG
ncbi:flagellar basal body rod C-terminal domain-containing protein [Sphingomonas morindae]|uniref:Flagellar biosynthesis protein FlgG n=1 Tax=Sphingomonas morindae TaxID=1541170 RepID=A0ABY4X4E9_9SPHN|nr:flagellar basal body rod C-terminal domain-containing protein [Sphingomonas morindae]USI71735.1 hypothetical protein LHA26_10395 [Sphingomonas morindae]